MMRREKKVLALLMALLLTISAVPAVYADDDASHPDAIESFEWTTSDRTLKISGTAGQEYVIVPENGGTLDWGKAQEPVKSSDPEDSGSYVTFSDLDYATTYLIFTRVKNGSGKIIAQEYTTGISSTSTHMSDEGLVFMKPVSVSIEPEDADVLYQWYYYEENTAADGSTQYTYTLIDGATSSRYMPFYDSELGKKLAVKITTRGYKPLETVRVDGAIYEPIFSVQKEATTIKFEGTPGQEYIIKEKGVIPTESDWKSSRKPVSETSTSSRESSEETYGVTFDNLSPATEYDIYTRPVGGEGNGAKKSTATVLARGVEITLPAGHGEDTPLRIGEVLTATSTPESTSSNSVNYQWCYEVITDEGEGYRRTVAMEIPGATGASYTISEYDVGQSICVIARAGDTFLERSDSVGPVSAAVGAPSIYSSDIESITVAPAENGKEYTIAVKDTSPDWSKAPEPVEGGVVFEGLQAGTEYEVYSRTKGSTSESAKALAYTKLNATLEFPTELKAGSVVSLDQLPSGSYTYQWYRGNPYEDADAVAIKEATGTSYTAVAEDEGHVIFLRILSGKFELGSGSTEERVKSAASATVKPVIVGKSANEIAVEGAWLHEYLIVPHGTPSDELDWEDANWEWIFDEDGAEQVVFEGLDPATTYDIYARSCGTPYDLAGTPKMTSDTTLLDNMGLDSGSVLLGSTLKVSAEPENVQGLTYQWCEEVTTDYTMAYSYDGSIVFDEEERERTDLFELSGKTGNSLEMTNDLVGKTLAVKFIKDGKVLGTMDEIGPVVETAYVEFDSNGGSEVEDQTDIRYGGKVAKPEDPTRGGRSFLGWYNSDGILWDFEKDTVTEDYIYLEASWSGGGGGSSSAGTTKVVAIGKDEAATAEGDTEGTAEGEEEGRAEGAETAEEGQSVVSESAKKAAEKFSDVNETSWYADAVGKAVDAGLLNGTSSTKFTPSAKTTREQAIAVLHRLASEGGEAQNEASGSATAPVGVSSWAVDDVLWALENGISDGKNPKESITREQFVTMLFRLMGGGSEGDPSSAVASSGMYENNLSERSELTEGTASPERGGGSERSELTEGFMDASKISSWAQEAFSWALEKGILNGYTDGSLKPQNEITRAELAQILLNLDKIEEA